MHLYPISLLFLPFKYSLHVTFYPYFSLTVISTSFYCSFLTHTYRLLLKSCSLPYDPLYLPFLFAFKLIFSVVYSAYLHLLLCIQNNPPFYASFHSLTPFTHPFTHPHLHSVLCILLIPAGIRDDPDQMGVIPNSFEHIFNHIARSSNQQFLIRASYLEIYQEEIR